MPWPLLLWGAGAVVTAAAGYKLHKEKQEEEERRARWRAEERREREMEEKKRRMQAKYKREEMKLEIEYGDIISIAEHEKSANDMAEQELAKMEKALEEIKKKAMKK